MMKRIILYLLFFASLYASAQTQTGYVKTIGRPGKPGIPLENVVVQMVGMVNPVTSSSAGEFHLSAYGSWDLQQR